MTKTGQVLNKEEAGKLFTKAELRADRKGPATKAYALEEATPPARPTTQPKASSEASNERTRGSHYKRNLWYYNYEEARRPDH